MLVRGLFALLIILPYWFLVGDKPWWLTLLVAAGAFGVAHLLEHWLRRAGDEQMRKKAKILLSVAVLAVGGGLLIRSSIAEADYYKHVHEVNANPARYVGKRLKVHGFVEAGSIDEKIVGSETTRTFVLEYQGQRIQVLEATDLTAKCPSKYEQDRRKPPTQASTQATN
jgi:cytochrome c-type biogenesis protein CcmE